MCDLFGLIADRPVSIQFSMLGAPRSFHARSTLNPDGWGIGYYDDGRAILRKEPVVANHSREFVQLANDARSDTFVAHIRYRTAGDISLTNTHPFEHANWMLAGKGGIGNLWHGHIRREVGPGVIHGETSGEHLLHWLYARAQGASAVQRPAVFAETLSKVCRDPGGMGFAAFILSTPAEIYAWSFLAPGARPFDGNGPRRLAFTVRRSCLIVATYPMTSECWEPIPLGHLFVADHRLNHHSFDVAASVRAA